MSRTGKSRPEAAAAASPRNILLIRLRRIGDVVMTTPAVAALRRAFPQASITYLIEEPFRRLVEGHPDIDRVIVVPKKQKAREFAALLRRIQKERFDTVIDFHGGPRAALITSFSGAKRRIGYKVKYKSFVYGTTIDRSSARGPIHSVENHLNLVRALGVEAGGTDATTLKLPRPRDEEIRRIDRIWEENGLVGAKVAAVHISAGNVFRDWGAGNWTALIDGLNRIGGVKIVLIGGESDADREKEVLSRTASRPVSLVGKHNLAELGEILRRSVLFIGPDSGPMHIADAAGTPIVALFGPTLPAHFAPWRSRAVIIEKPLDCRPCRQQECICGDFRCLRDITVADVLSAIHKMRLSPR